MTKNSKKVVAMISGISTVAIGAAMSIIALTPSDPIEIPYEIYNKSQYITAMKLDMPLDETVDLVELYVNNTYVDNAIMPNGVFKSIPLVFTNNENLSFKMYHQGELCGTGKFNEENKLLYSKR